jgi:hypothetical protein
MTRQSEIRATLPKCFPCPSDCEIRTRKYGVTRLTVVADTVRAEKPIMYMVDNDGEWQGTPFQTATIRHDINGALSLVWRWLANS